MPDTSQKIRHTLTQKTRPLRNLYENVVWELQPIEPEVRPLPDETELTIQAVSSYIESLVALADAYLNQSHRFGISPAPNFHAVLYNVLANAAHCAKEVNTALGRVPGYQPKVDGRLPQVYLDRYESLKNLAA